MNLNFKKLTGISLLALALPLTSISFIALALPFKVLAAAKAIPEGKYTIDPMHSKIGFEVPHLVVSSVEGRFNQFEGVITVNKAINKSKVEFSADVASIDTGVTNRDDHLKSPDFFDTAKFAKMTFSSSKVTQTDDTLTITGNLKIKDKTKEVTITAKYLGAMNDGSGNEKIAFKGSALINRKDFGLTYGKVLEAGPVIGDDVTISLSLQAAKAKK